MIRLGALHALGRLANRLLLAPERRSPARLAAYRVLYVAAKRLADREALRLVRRHLEPGMTVLDIGAHAGVYTSAFAAAVGRAGRVVAFEPDPLARELLVARCGRLGNVEVVPFAAGERRETRLLHAHAANRPESGLALPAGTPAAEHVEVEVRTVDEVCRRRGISRVDAVKIDVQGWEVAVLRGMRETVERSPPRWLLVELEPRLLAAAGAGGGELTSLLEAYGYRARPVGEVASGGRRPCPAPQVARSVDLWASR